MGTATIFPYYAGVFGVGGATSGATDLLDAIDDTSDTSYYYFNNSNVGSAGGFQAWFHNIRTAIGSNVVITGISILCRSTTDNAYNLIRPTEIFLNSNYAYHSTFQTSPVLVTDGTFQDFQTTNAPRTNASSFGVENFWEDVITSDSDYLAVFFDLAGTHTGSWTNKVSEVALIVEYSEAPTLADIQPKDLSASTTFTSTPTIQWTYTDADDDSQAKLRLIVGDETVNDGSGNAPGSGSFDPTDWGAGTFYDSGWITSSSAEKLCSTNLLDTAQCRAYVMVSQTPPLSDGREQYSAWAYSAAFTVDAAPGPTLSMNSMVDPQDDTAILLWGMDNGDEGTGRTVATVDLEYADSTDGSTFPTWTKARGYSDAMQSPIYTGCYFDGASGDYMHIADDASYAPGSNPFRVEVLTAISSVAAATATLMGQTDGSTDIAFSLFAYLGKLGIVGTADGSTTVSVTTTASISAIASDKQWIWLAADITPGSPGSVQFQYSYDGTTWVDWESAKSWAVSSVYDSSAELTIGAQSGGTTNRLTGWVREANFYINGSLVAGGAIQRDIQDAATWNDDLGNTWTRAGSGTRWSLGFIERDYEVPSVKYRAWRVRSYDNDGTNDLYSDWTDSTASAEQLTLTAGTWYLKVPEDSSLNMTVSLLPGSLDADVPKEKAVYKALGRTTVIMVTDGVKKPEWPFTFEVTSSTELAALRALYESDLIVFVQSTMPLWQDGLYVAFEDFKQKLGDPVGEYWQITMPAWEQLRP